MKVARYLVLFASLVGGRSLRIRQVSAQAESRASSSSSRRTARRVKSPVHLKFGIENYKIAAVPDGT